MPLAGGTLDRLRRVDRVARTFVALGPLVPNRARCSSTDGLPETARMPLSTARSPAHAAAMKLLVTYGSKLGGTEGLAEMVGNSLRRAGFDVDVLPARQVASIGGYDAVVVGGALYAGRWHRDAVRFVKRHQRRLHTLPVWLFSSGPLDDSAETKDIPPVSQVRRLMRSIEANGHATFGGRLEPGARGFLAGAMAKKLSGDWRDPEHIARWTAQIVDALTVVDWHQPI
jgi:menaquinone-dependent protoporphyrinogen oxidase